MTAVRVTAAVIAVLLVAVYALGSGRWVTTSAPWYLSLHTPPWQPPGAVFGLAWAYNFTVLAIVGVAMSVSASGRALTAYLLVFAVSIVLALLWAWLFYGPHRLLESAVALSLAAIVTVAMLVIAFRQSGWMGGVLVPYELWLIIASSLSWGYWVLNRVT